MRTQPPPLSSSSRSDIFALHTHRPYRLPSSHATLPYKPDEASAARVEWEYGSRADHEYLNGVMAQFSSSLVGEESSLQLLEKG
jgi:hypothetical protein